MNNRSTRVLQAINPDRDRNAIQEAGEALHQGKLVVFPTETVYGIGANALDEMAVSDIFEAKGRPQDNPLIVHVTHMDDVVPLVTEISDIAKALAEAFWPGPLTLIFPSSGRIPNMVSAGLDTVAIRLPSHPVARAVIQAAGVPIAAPSANRSGSPSPTIAQHCILDLDGRVDLILDGGPCAVGVESTVLSLAGKIPRLLRPGGITAEMLREVIGEIQVDPAVLEPLGAGLTPASPGMKYRHYAPQCEVLLVHGTLEQYLRFLFLHREEGAYAMCFEGEEAQLPLPAITYGRADDPEEQASHLFAALRQLDEIGAKKVFVRPPAPQGVGLAVLNRLLRAASFRQVSAGGGYGEPRNKG